MKTVKKIKSLKVVRAGSNPDVDSDFNTERRADVLEHVRELYGFDNVASIGTFNTLRGKSAFKSMCTIYEIPFAQANKIADLFPDASDDDGNKASLADVYNPRSDFYRDGADFRNATEGEEWKPIIAGALAIEGKNKNTGMHPCGVVISSKPLSEVIPLQVRQDDGTVVTQWTYGDLESLGLIKMDFLGLDTVDLIQHTVENINKAGKGPINMMEIINGPMDDKKTFEMLSKGDTIGLFQLASDGVQDLLKRIKPTVVDDIIATTALFRPGPMGMNSHIKYADRKNGREEVDYIHEDFRGTAVEEILATTYGLCVPENTLILNAVTGEYVAIKDIPNNGSFVTPSLNETTGRAEAKPVVNVIETGVKKIVKITTNSQRTLRVSEDHPVKTDRGYIAAGEIKPGDFIAPLSGTKLVENADNEADSFISKLTSNGVIKASDAVELTDLKLSLFKLGVNFSASDSTLELVPQLSDIERISNGENASPALQANSSLQIAWAEVSSVESDGEENCFDIEVEDNHNFMVDGFIVHNCVYQEQVMKLASTIANFTLQEADDLRKAMGKKQIDKMAKAKPMFIKNGLSNGFSEEALQLMWDTLAEFAKYGFNKAHSVAYGMTAYQASYLKANYPVEFMAALISQNVGNKDKITPFLRETKKMGIKIGSIDINTSDVRVAPDFTGKSEFDIVFGFSGALAVSEDNARLIVKEREANGPFKSVQDFVTRCYSKGIANKKIFENIAKAGGFDSLGVSRRGVVENLPALIGSAKTKETKGADLFDMFSSVEEISSHSVDLSKIEEYPHVEKLKMEADVVGLYLTDHPLSKAGPGLSKARSMTIEQLMKAQATTTVKITGALTDILKKVRRGGKNFILTIDDGTGFIRANLAREIVKGMDKKVAQDKIRQLYQAGANELNEDLLELATDSEFKPMPELEKNSVYSMTLTFRPARGESPYGARINTIEKLHLSDDGSLPIRMRFLYDDASEAKMRKLLRALPKAVAERNPGNYSIVTAFEHKNSVNMNGDYLYEAAAKEIRTGLSRSKSSATSAAKEDLMGGAIHDAPKKKGKAEDVRPWPPASAKHASSSKSEELTEDRIRSLIYSVTPYKADKVKRTELDIEKYLGVEGYDFGVFDPSILKD